MRVEIRPAMTDDVPVLAASMRSVDVAEVSASHGMGPTEILDYALRTSSYAWSGFIDGEIVCMFGVAPVSILVGKGSPWLLATDRLERWPRTFLRRCRACVAAMCSVYPWLENYVDERNTVSQRWLKWLGFTLDDTTVTMRSGAAFRHFEMKGGV